MRTLPKNIAGLAIATAALASLPAESADHREAPAVSRSPAADINDIYAFRSPASASNVVLIMTVNPVADPDFATTYAFAPDVVYEFAIDRTGDARFDASVAFLFEPLNAGVQQFTAYLPGGRTVTGQTTRPTVASAGANAPVINTSTDNTIKIFAGPTDDPFFFDGVGFTRTVAGTGGFRGEDSFATFNVSSIVIELPAAIISGGATALQIEGFTYVEVFPPLRPQPRRVRIGDRRFAQFDRMGNPAVATAFIPLAQRDAFNLSQPADDARDFAPTILASLATFGTSDPNIAILASVAVPDTLKLDLSQNQGFPNGRTLDDDVIDTLLTLVFNGPTHDGVNANDVAFRNTFPYLAAPQQAN